VRSGRRALESSPAAAAIAVMKRADELFSEPTKIEQVDLLAAKVPG